MKQHRPPTNRAVRRKANGESYRRLIAHVTLHGYYPILEGRRGIAQAGGSAFYIDGTSYIQEVRRHSFTPGTDENWPPLATLRALARRAGIYTRGML